MLKHRFKSKKLTDSARNRDCEVRLPDVCNFNPETSCLAHPNGGGMGTKHSDILGAFCCSACHDVLDGRVPSHYGVDYLDLAQRQGNARTINIWLQEGLIKLP